MFAVLPKDTDAPAGSVNRHYAAVIFSLFTIEAWERVLTLVYVFQSAILDSAAALVNKVVTVFELVHQAASWNREGFKPGRGAHILVQISTKIPLLFL